MNHDESGKTAGHAWTPLGSRLPKIVRMPSSSASTPTSSGKSSETSGPASPARAAASSTGRLHSETAVSNLPAPLDEVRAITAPATERQSRNAVAALLQRLNGSSGAVAWIDKPIFGPDGQSDFEIVGVKGLTSDRAALLAMEDALEPVCRPARQDPEAERRIVVEVSKLFAVTAGRKREGSDDDLALETIVDDLSAFPADCVLRALGAMRRGSHWRPTLAALIVDTEWRAKPRLAAMKTIRKALEAGNV